MNTLSFVVVFGKKSQRPFVELMISEHSLASFVWRSLTTWRFVASSKGYELSDRVHHVGSSECCPQGKLEAAVYNCGLLERGAQLGGAELWLLLKVWFQSSVRPRRSRPEELENNPELFSHTQGPRG